MKITADTNVLQDDAEQAAVAQSLFLQATVMQGSLFSLLSALFSFLPAVEAGLTALRTGGDFADGALAYQGEMLGGTVFASFDRNAVALLRNEGAEAADPAELIA